VASAARFENEWDQKLDFTCPPNSGQGIYFIETDGHFNSMFADKNDRKWGFDCKNMGASKDKFGCKWYSGIDDGWHKEKQWINNFKEDFKIQCPNHGIVAGFKSIHNNNYEDRIWNVYCCTGSHAFSNDCEWKLPTKTNNDDWKFQFDGERSFIRGVKSKFIASKSERKSFGPTYHVVDGEDRHWEFEVCQMRYCTQVPGSDDPKRTPVTATKGTREVNSVSTSLNCNSRHTIEFEEGPETIQTNSVEISSTKGKESSTSHAASFSVGVKAKAGGCEISATAGGSVETTKSKSTETTDSKTYSTSSTTYAVQFDWFTGPSVMMIMSESDTYKFTDNSYKVTELLQCEGEEEPRELTKQVSINVKTYGQTHFTTRYAKFKSEKDCLDNQAAIEKCLNNLKFMKGENEAIGEAFEKCFAKKDSSGNVLYQDKKNIKERPIPQWIDAIVAHGVTL